MTINFNNAIVRTIVGMTGAVLLATTFVGAATAPAQATTVQTSLSTRTI